MGSFDGAVFRYFLLVCDFIDLVDWRSVDDFRGFAAVIYPFLNVSHIFHGMAFKLYEITPEYVFPRLFIYCSHVILNGKQRVSSFSTQDKSLCEAHSTQSHTKMRLSYWD